MYCLSQQQINRISGGNGFPDVATMTYDGTTASLNLHNSPTLLVTFYGFDSQNSKICIDMDVINANLPSSLYTISNQESIMPTLPSSTYEITFF